MRMYVVLSNRKEKSSYLKLALANKDAKERTIRTDSRHEVLRSLHTFAGESGKLLR